MDMKRRDYLIRATAHGGLVRALAIDATGVADEITQRHQTAPAVTAALGRLATGALLFGARLKEDAHSITLRINGDGPAGVLMATANASGSVRGLVSNPRPDVEQVANGKLNVSGAVGSTGEVSVTKDLGMRQPYVGKVELVSGEIGEDLAHYLLRSEQVQSALGIGVFVPPDGSVEAAGGYLIELMPDVPDAVAAELEAAITALPHPTAMLRAGEGPEDILRRVFGDDFDDHRRPRRPLRVPVFHRAGGTHNPHAGRRRRGGDDRGGPRPGRRGSHVRLLHGGLPGPAGPPGVNVRSGRRRLICWATTGCEESPCFAGVAGWILRPLLGPTKVR
jgi:molecular chaperone Hsp33